MGFNLAFKGLKNFNSRAFMKKYKVICNTVKKLTSASVFAGEVFISS